MRIAVDTAMLDKLPSCDVYGYADAFIDYVRNGGTVRQCADRWKWSKTKAGKCIAVFEEYRSVRKKQEHSSPVQMSAFEKQELHITHNGIRSFEHEHIYSISLSELELCHSTGNDYDGSPLDDDERRYVSFTWWIRKFATWCSRYDERMKQFRQVSFEEYRTLASRLTSNQIRDAVLRLESTQKTSNKHLYQAILQYAENNRYNHE